MGSHARSSASQSLRPNSAVDVAHPSPSGGKLNADTLSLLRLATHFGGGDLDRRHVVFGIRRHSGDAATGISRRSRRPHPTNGLALPLGGLDLSWPAASQWSL